MNPRHLLLTAAAALLLSLGSSSIAGAAPITTDGLTTETPASQRSLARAAQVGDTEPNLVDQWALNGDRAMGMTTAWQQITGGDVVVAVIDSGIAMNHRELSSNLWTNAGEIPGNGVDDDGNGFVDDVHGYDFIGGDSDPSDANGHGTHVAGIIGARGDNGIGGSGVAQRVKLMAVRVLDANASGTTDGVAAGLRYAADNGAKIANLSLAGTSGSDALLASILYAQLKGVLVVAAAGNDGADLSQRPAFPASYIVDNIIGVAATKENLGLADISNYGNGADIAAPGADILSTASDGGYEWRTGTSMAAPAVTGTLALLAAARPDLDALALRAALFAGATHSGLPVGVGSLNAAGALRQVIDPSAWKAPAPKAATKGSRSLPTTLSLPNAAAKRTATVKKTSSKKATSKKACRKPSKRASKKAKAKYKKCVRAANAKAKAKAAKAAKAKAKAAKAKAAKR